MNGQTLGPYEIGEPLGKGDGSAFIFPVETRSPE